MGKKVGVSRPYKQAVRPQPPPENHENVLTYLLNTRLIYDDVDVGLAVQEQVHRADAHPAQTVYNTFHQKQYYYSITRY